MFLKQEELQHRSDTALLKITTIVDKKTMNQCLVARKADLFGIFEFIPEAIEEKELLSLHKEKVQAYKNQVSENSISLSSLQQKYIYMIKQVIIDAVQLHNIRRTGKTENFSHSGLFMEEPHGFRSFEVIPTNRKPGSKRKPKKLSAEIIEPQIVLPPTPPSKPVPARILALDAKEAPIPPPIPEQILPLEDYTPLILNPKKHKTIIKILTSLSITQVILWSETTTVKLLLEILENRQINCTKIIKLITLLQKIAGNTPEQKEKITALLYNTNEIQNRLSSYKNKAFSFKAGEQKVNSGKKLQLIVEKIHRCIEIVHDKE